MKYSYESQKKALNYLIKEAPHDMGKLNNLESDIQANSLQNESRKTLDKTVESF